MSVVVAKLRPLLTPATGKHTGSLIFLHGSGDSGFGVMNWLQIVNDNVALSFPHLRVIYPTAPERPYTPMGGQVSNVWFDRKQISPYSPEDTDSVEQMCGLIDALVDLETKRGIPRNRIVLGGFSMGGALSMYYGYKYAPELAAIFGLSSFLSEDSKVYETLEKASPQRLPPLFQCHGKNDPLVNHDWGKSTADKLMTFGVDSTFHSIPEMFHELKNKEVELLKEWITERIPEE